MIRLLVVAAAILLVGAQVVRDAAVQALAELHPASAARVWPDHPAIEISLALQRIGEASRERRQIDPAIFAMIDDAAAKSPLSPEPFLVHGVRAQSAGDPQRASRAFVAAQWRDPRSSSAAYFLAAYDFKTGRSLEGLEESALVARLSPGGSTTLAPYIAAYAQDRSHWAQIRMFLRAQPGEEDSVLTLLARSPGGADAVLAIADPQHRRPDSPWLPVLLYTLVGQGNYARAHAIWSAIGAGKPGQLLADPDFSQPQAPPPFNWSLVSSTLGLAERENKQLHVIFYGTDDGVLASQLLVLAPGTYRLQMQLSGAPAHAEALHWSIRCDNKSDGTLSKIGLEDAAQHGWTVQVPAGCPAQWLELAGTAGDVAEQSEVTIAGLSLTPVGVHG